MQGWTSIGGHRRLLFGRAATADGENAVPYADGAELRDWATAQAQSIPTKLCDDEPDAAADVASIVYHCGGDVSDLPFCYSNLGWMKLADLRDWIGNKTEVLLAERDLIEDAFRFVDDITINSNAVLAEGIGGLGWIGGRAVWPAAFREQTDNRWWDKHQRTLKGLVVSTLAAVWAVSVDEVLRASEFSMRIPQTLALKNSTYGETLATPE